MCRQGRTAIQSVGRWYVYGKHAESCFSRRGFIVACKFCRTPENLSSVAGGVRSTCKFSETYEGKVTPPTRHGKPSRKGSGPICRWTRPSRELRPHSPLETDLTSSPTSLTMKCVDQKKISLLRRILPAPSSPGNISRLPYMCTT